MPRRCFSVGEMAARDGVWTHRKLGADGYAEIVEHSGEAPVTPLFPLELRFGWLISA